jgi:hypothetical protein
MIMEFSMMIIMADASMIGRWPATLSPRRSGVRRQPHQRRSVACSSWWSGVEVVAGCDIGRAKPRSSEVS